MNDIILETFSATLTAEAVKHWERYAGDDSHDGLDCALCVLLLNVGMTLKVQIEDISLMISEAGRAQ